jgi:hypothetical protein
MTTTKIEKLMAIKEQFANTQARLVAARKLEESAKAGSLSTLLENDLEQAELVLAAQDIMHKLQNMAEDLAKMNAQDLFPLVDKMKATFGQEAAHAFEETAQEAISGAMNTVRHAKDELGNSIMRIEGKLPASDMAKDSGMDTGAGMDASPAAAPEAGGEEQSDLAGAMDSFGGADAASGPDAEPLGRARKESREGGRALNESVILESAGHKLLVSEGIDSLISWVLKEAAAGMPEEHFRSFATSVAQKAARDPAKLAGWIGKKRDGFGAMAQLARSTNTAAPELEVADEVMEGKSFKKNDADDNNWNKKSKDSERNQARKNKQGDEKVDEGKSFKKGNDEEDKADRFAARNQARKNKADGESKVDEGKSFKKNSDDGDKADRFAARNQARKNKADGEDKVDEGKTFKKNDADDDNWKKKNSSVEKNQARKSKQGDDKVDESQLAARAIAQLIEASIKREGKGKAASAVKEAVAFLAGKNLNEDVANLEAKIMEAFESQYGMKPAAYSIGKLREFIAPMNPNDKKNASSAMTKVAGKMGANPSAGKQSVSSAMQGMSGQERTAATKVLNTMKKNGQNPKNAGEFAAGASSLIDGDEDAVNENINAAHWPVDTQGQYKGEPMSTDYGKLKPITGAPKAGKTEGGAPEPKVEEPKVEGAKAPEGGEKPEGGKPWQKTAKKEAPKEEPTDSDDDDDSEK